jgi:hypothetical protein
MEPGNFRDSLALYRAEDIYSNNESSYSSSLSSESGRETPDFSMIREEVTQVSSIVCPVCFESFDSNKAKPLILPKCGHTVCLACLKRIIKASSLVKCPVCRKNNPTEIWRLPVNSALLEFSQPKAEDAICQLHRLEIVGFCFDEMQVLCGACVIEHQEHKVLDLNDPLVAEIAEKRREELKNEEDQLVALQNTWQRTMESLDILNRNIEGLKSCHLKGFKSAESKMMQNVITGSQECLNQLESIENCKEVKEIGAEINENLKCITAEITKAKERTEKFESLSIFEKLTKPQVLKTNVSIPSLGPLYNKVLRLKGEVNYKMSIKRHQIYPLF